MSNMTPETLRTLAGCLRAIRFTAWAIELDAAASAWEADIDAKNKLIVALNEANANIAIVRNRLDAAVRFVEAAAEMADTGVVWAEKAQAWLDAALAGEET